jgi:pyruvate dehydrogenase E1 component
MPEMPRRKGIKEGILKGMYRFKKSDNPSKDLKANLFGSGTILNEVIKAGEMLEKDYGVSSDIWSITSYKELYRDAIDTDRWNMLNPEKEQKVPYVTGMLNDEQGVFVAASDYIKALPASISQWMPGPFTMLGTDGFGRSEDRERLRDFFEVDARYIVAATLGMLAKEGKIKTDVVLKAIKDMKLKQDKPNPIIS